MMREEGGEREEGGRRRHVTLMMTDIRGEEYLKNEAWLGGVSCNLQ